MCACCVPFCDSTKYITKKIKQSTNGTKVSLHEFPCSPAVREAWIKAIARIDPETNDYWIPSESSFVCSLHFKPEQYRTTKNRCLLPGSVPCIFPGYPEYLLQNSAVIKRFGSLPRKNAINSSNASKEIHPIIVKDTSNENGMNNATVNINKCIVMKVQIPEKLGNSVNSSSKNEASPCKSVAHPCAKTDANIIEESLSEQYNNNSFLVNDPLQNNSKIPISESVLNIDSCMQNFDNFIQNKTSFKSSGSSFINNTDHVYYTKTKQDRLCERKEKCLLASKIKSFIHKNDKSKQLRNNDEYFKVLKTKIASAERRIRRYKAAMLKLREENEKIQFINEIVTEKFKEYNIEELEKGIENKNAKALFLIDQLHSLAKEKILWSRSTMEFTKRFEEKFPASYSFLKQTDVVSLPCSKLLKFNHEKIDDFDSDD